MIVKGILSMIVIGFALFLLAMFLLSFLALFPIIGCIPRIILTLFGYRK
jgi:hypothetical protein